MKSHKPKIVIASLGALTILATGTAYAYSDADSQLRTWYQSRFQQATDEINYSTVLPSQGQMTAALSQKTEKLMTEAQVRMTEEQELAFNQANGTIWMVNGGYIKELRDGRKQLVNMIPIDFQKYVDGKIRENNGILDRAASDYISDLTSKLDQEAVKSAVSISINAAEAKSQLSERISAAKLNVTTDLETKKTEAVEELKSHLDQTIESGKQELQSYSNEQASEQVRQLHETAVQLEQQSKQALDSVVNQINQP